MHFAGDDLEGLAVEEKLAVGNAERRLLGARGVKGREGQRQKSSLNSETKESVFSGSFHSG
jgi:hypothetical protein